jgi:molybdate transport repressor ModE-like protein
MQPVRRWPGIELRHLEALSVVADEGSFRRAARRLGYTQSAISQQIAALERAIGHPVLERPSRGRPLALTDVGTRLRRLYDTVEQAMTAARADVSAAAAGAASVIRIGIAFGLPHLADAVVAARARNPRVLVELVRGAEDDRLVRSVETAALDFAVVRSPTAGDGVTLRQVSSCSYVVAIPASGPLARTKTRLGLCDVSGFARIGTADGTAYADDSQAAIVAADAEMALELVGAGAGVAVLPGILACAAQASVALRPLRDILPPFQISLASRLDLPPAGTQVADLVAAAIEGWPGAEAAGKNAAPA